MRNIHIDDSYNTWSVRTMKNKIDCAVGNLVPADVVLNRPYISMYVEWWLHNTGYYITKPFCHIEAIHKINLRCKDVDLEEWT